MARKFGVYDKANPDAMRDVYKHDQFGMTDGKVQQEEPPIVPQYVISTAVRNLISRLRKGAEWANRNPYYDYYPETLPKDLESAAELIEIMIDYAEANNDS